MTSENSSSINIEEAESNLISELYDVHFKKAKTLVEQTKKKTSEIILDEEIDNNLSKNDHTAIKYIQYVPKGIEKNKLNINKAIDKIYNPKFTNLKTNEGELKSFLSGRHQKECY